MLKGMYFKLFSTLKHKITRLSKFSTISSLQPGYRAVANKKPPLVRTFIFRRSSIQDFKELDKLPDSYTLIYRNRMYRYLLFAQFTTTISCAIVCIAAIYADEYNPEIHPWGNPIYPEMTTNEGLFYICVFILLASVLQAMIYKTPIRIYNDPKKQKYCFVFYGSMPSTRKYLTCTAKDIFKTESSLSPWSDSTYKIENQRKVIMLENYFRRPADLNIMLGYQKQPDDYE